ncbi:hypothetical protein PF008_g3205 [Phytophthora fragariae]|uniref:RRM domain-containing protein n=1 Tax=Phytophthora fragariae TaxID=53985 RepID=A0A6G0SFZ5_9STRA|nr:hypothetical protein PF008_g3205 [Phytophthora fragariae]
MSAPQRKPATLDTYIQAAIDANAVETHAPPRKTTRRRKKQQQPIIALPDPFHVKSLALSPPIPAKPKRRKRRSKLKSSIVQSRQVSTIKFKFRVRGLVAVEELEDEDEADEVQQEIRQDFSRFGELQTVAIVRGEDEGSDLLLCDVVVEFRDAEDAVKAFTAFNGKVFGGKTMTCVWSEGGDLENSIVVVQGILAPEELEDPDEVEDVKEEVMQFFTKHGLVKGMVLDETTGDVTVTFSDSQDAVRAVDAVNGSRYGGCVVTARLIGGEGEAGDRVERSQVQMKRVATCIVQHTDSPELRGLVGTFLTRLATLQERAHALNPRQDKRSRRLVLGLHEVRRGLLNKKIHFLIIATDVEECEAVQEKVAEIRAIAAEQEVPLLSPMNRRKLGRALQKKILQTISAEK